MFSNLWSAGSVEDRLEGPPMPLTTGGSGISAAHQDNCHAGSKRLPPAGDHEEGSRPGKSASWSLLAAWGEEDTSRAKRQPSPRKVPALTIAALPHGAKGGASPTKPLSDRTGSAKSSKGDTHSTRSSARRTTAPSSHAASQPGGPGEECRPRASPGAVLRHQSASTSPCPHPLPDLMRLTAGRHLIPMARIIHSMASLSRAGRENSQRKQNQDSCFAFRQYVQPYQAIAGVMDGHGPNGAAVSGFLRQQLPVAVAEQLRRRGEVSAGAALSAAFLETQDALRSASGAINARLSGSTAVLTLVQGRRLTTAWVGDSRAVLVRKEVGGGVWRGVALTQDHKPTSAGELARILAAGGRVERLSDGLGREVGPQRVWLPGAWVPGLAMSRAMGDFVAHQVGVISEPEVHCCELEDGDEFLVVASDGVWEFMTVQEAAEVVGKCGSAEDACRALVDEASARWSAVNEGVTDDISAVVAKFLPREEAETRK